MYHSERLCQLKHSSQRFTNSPFITAYPTDNTDSTVNRAPNFSNMRHLTTRISLSTNTKNNLRTNNLARITFYNLSEHFELLVTFTKFDRVLFHFLHEVKL